MVRVVPQPQRTGLPHIGVGRRRELDSNRYTPRLLTLDQESGLSDGLQLAVGATNNGAATGYLLSTLLGVTSGRGISVSETLRQLQRAAKADGSAPAGTIYFLANDDIRSTTRHWAYPSTATALRKLGVQAEVLRGILPTDRADVAGAMVGTAGFEWSKAGSTILPGAICEHLTSCGGILGQQWGQTPLTEFLRHGAAGASGTADEPYAIQSKFPLAYLHLHYARGSTLAEAFMQSVAGPYQLVVVGDPLCAPWARRPDVRVTGLKTDAPVRGTVRVRAVARRPGARVQGYEFFVDGRRVAMSPRAEFSLDTTTLAEGPHELGVAMVLRDATGTTGWARHPFVVANRTETLTLRAHSVQVPLDEDVQLAAVLSEPGEIAILQNSRVLHSAPGNALALTIPAARLGLGPVSLLATGRTAQGAVVSAPLRLNITPPLARPARELGSAAVARGLRVIPAGGTAAIAASTRPADWLSKAGVGTDVAFTVEAVFEAPADDLYQFQLQSPLPVDLRVDDHPLPTERTGDWQYLPVHLARGWHHLTLHVPEGAGQPLLDLRFGGSGTYSLDETRFCHLVDAAAPSQENTP